MAQLGIIADDLAGAIECGAILMRQGMSTAVAIGLPEDALPEADALAIVPRTRNAPVTQAVAESLAACEALLAAGTRQILQLVDPGFEGAAIAPVTDALLRRLQASFAAIAPGAPSSGRTVYLGHLFTGTALAGGEPNLPRRLAMQADAPVALIPFRIMEEGAGAIRREMSRLVEAGRRYAIADSLTDEHLLALGAAAAAQALLVGSPGIALGLPKNFGHPSLGSIPAEDVPDGPAAVLAASGARATIAQLGLARLYCPTLDLDGTLGATEALDWAAAQKPEDGPLVIAASPTAADAPGTGELLAALAEGLVAQGVTRLLIAGEAAFPAVVERLGIRQLRIGAEIDSGLPWCTVAGSGLHILLKPGAAGRRDILLRAFS
ncbi:four-carbon acid sugar kinase family protein [Roseomonas xinghualingensis]|uniref:four-carbon acid sugar kinase family protein n=1 Tax=Roseomonas xinghualingensis TaxID=2986475 RepID=UPI0021F1C344|nr:four-carbon acid sugar kinase family protein [Roseomonas sp. SXEYE001]MCV4208109.1 hypothetical protein [Roseomonas sp. SXEYE001]